MANVIEIIDPYVDPVEDGSSMDINASSTEKGGENILNYIILLISEENKNVVIKHDNYLTVFFDSCREDIDPPNCFPANPGTCSRS